MRKPLFAPHAIAVSIKTVDVLSNDSYRALNIGRTVTATPSTVDVTSDRNAGTRVIGVAGLCGGDGRRSDGEP